MLCRSHGLVSKKILGRNARWQPFEQPRPHHCFRGAHSQVQPPLSQPVVKNETRNSGKVHHVSSKEVMLHTDTSSASFHTRKLEQRTNALLKLPPGLMDFPTWRQAREMLDLWTKKASFHASKKAEQLLERMVKEAAANEHVQLNATVYNQCINAWAKSGATDAALRVETILERMQSRYNEAPDSAPEPDTISFNTLLHTIAMSEDERATEKAEELIHLMEERHRMNPDGAVNPTTWSYNLVMLAYANRVGEYGSAKAAEDWLLRLSELNIDDGPRPDTHSFNLVLMAWANSQDEKGPDRALEILRLFIKLSNEGHDVYPDASSFTTVISAFAKRGQVMKAQEVLYLIREVDLPERTDITSCINAVIDSWAKSGAKDAGHMAETVLSSAQSFFGLDASVVFTPNVISYTACLDAHTKSDDPHALENAEDFLHRMIGSFRSGEWKEGPTTKTFICMIDAWAKSDRENRAEQAELWLRTMNDISKHESFKCQPSSQAFNICINAWADSDAPNAAARASMLLRNMEQAYEKGNRFARPNGFSYRVVIKKLLSSGKKSDALEALFLVKRMEEQARRGNDDAEPDTATCYKVIYKLIQTGDEEAIKGALNLIRWMDEASQNGLTCMRPDTLTFTTVMSALSKLPMSEAKSAVVKLYDRMEELSAIDNSSVYLNSKAVRIALTSLSSMGEKRAADKACSLVDRIARLDATNNPVKLLDGISLTACLDAVLRVGTFEYTLKAHELLKDMMTRYHDGASTYLPLRRAFVWVVDALSKSRQEDAVDLVQEILDLMEDLPFEGHFREGPGALFYSKTIDLLIQHGKLEEAEAVLLSYEHKIRLHEDAERLNVITWNKVLRAWSKSSAEDKVSRARGLLDRMKEYANEGNGEAMPDLTSYNTVLNAASFVSSKHEVRQDALRIAIATYEEIKKQHLFLRPDEVTYGTMLKAVGRLTIRGSDKTDLSTTLFEECCANGQDGPMVMKEICKNLSDDEIHEIRNKVTAPRRQYGSADVREAS